MLRENDSKRSGCPVPWRCRIACLSISHNLSTEKESQGHLGVVRDTKVAEVVVRPPNAVPRSAVAFPSDLMWLSICRSGFCSRP